MLKQIANEVWKKCQDELGKDDNKKLLEHYVYKPVNGTISDLKMYFLLSISVQIVLTILIFLILIMLFIHASKKIS
jgi:hypothetical protein